MTLSLLAGELRKAATLPASSVAAAVAVLGSAAVTALNATSVTADGGGTTVLSSAVDVAFAAAPLGTVGAVVLGVVAIGGEYTPTNSDAGSGRQMTSTLTAAPRRLRLFAVKAVVVALLVAATALVSAPVSVALAHALVGGSVDVAEAAGRLAGAGLYWLCSALIAFAITVLARSVLIPLIVLVVNNSLVSFSLLLTTVTSAAHWLPDLAGRRLFGAPTVPGGLDAVTGGAVMGGWTLALLVVAAVVFHRRDA